MKKILLFLSFLLMSIGMWGDSYTITFGNNANSATALSSSVSASTAIISGTSYVTPKPFTVNSGNCYYGGDDKNNIRVGKTKESASLTISLSATGQVYATSIVVNCKYFNSNNSSATLDCNGVGAEATSSTPTDITFSINNDITSILLEGTKAVLIYSITVNYSSTPPPTKYKVTYNANGGTGTVTDVTEYDPNAIVTTLNNTFLKNDSIFDNWNTKSDGTGSDIDEGSTFTITKDTTLYAKWLKNVIGKISECNIFYESFDGNTGETQYSGGNDGRWNGSGTANATPVVLDNEGWLFPDDNGKGGDRCIRLGTGSKAGDAETPAITYTETQPLLLTFKAGAWNGTSEYDTIILSSTNCNLSDTAVKIEKGKWGVYNILLTSVSNNFKIKWQSKYISNNRFFLDSICISSSETPIEVVSWYKDSIFLSKDYFKDINFSAEKIRIKPIQGKVSLVNMADSTLKVNVDLSGSYCDTLHFIVCNSTEAVEQHIKIPYIVSSSINLPDTDDLCDVVVSPKATLTVNNNGLTNRDVYVYPEAKLSINTGNTFHVNSIVMRRDNDSVPYLSNSGTLDISDGIYFEMRTDGDDWRWLTLPDTFRINEINGNVYDNVNGGPLIKYYNGSYRSEHGSGGWQWPFNNTIDYNAKFAPGVGVNFGEYNPKSNTEKRIYRLKLNTSILDLENSTKGIDVYPYGKGTNKPANDLGWNAVGNPFMDKCNITSSNPIRIGVLKKDSVDGKWTGKWIVDSISTKLNYIVVKNHDDKYADAGYYESIPLKKDAYSLEPFTSFFVQIDTALTSPTTLIFTKESGVGKAPAKTISEDEEIFLRVNVGDKKTGCFISNKYSDKYEIGEDLESNESIYQSINGYKLLYSAINDSILLSGVKVYTAGGTLSLDEKTDVHRFGEIKALYNNELYDLLNGDTVEVSGEFILFGNRKQDNVATVFEENYKNVTSHKVIVNGILYIIVNDNVYNILGEIIR